MSQEATDSARARRSTSKALDPREGDDWMQRRTKQVIREISKQRAEAGLTTEELADRCNAWLGSSQPGITVAWLNSLFAGKRKTLTVPELEMFAATLRLGLDKLLYPVASDVETRPGQRTPSADALMSALDRDQSTRALDGQVLLMRADRFASRAAAFAEGDEYETLSSVKSAAETLRYAMQHYEATSKEAPPHPAPEVTKLLVFIERMPDELGRDDDVQSHRDSLRRFLHGLGL